MFQRWSALVPPRIPVCEVIWSQWTGDSAAAMRVRISIHKSTWLTGPTDPVHLFLRHKNNCVSDFGKEGKACSSQPETFVVQSPGNWDHVGRKSG